MPGYLSFDILSRVQTFRRMHCRRLRKETVEQCIVSDLKPNEKSYSTHR